MNNQGLPCTLAHLSTLRQNVYDAEKSYMKAPFGQSFVEHQALKNARGDWADACCKYIEIMLDTECKECENIGTVTEEAVNINTLIMLEKLNEQLV